jgi:hypothetical protein
MIWRAVGISALVSCATDEVKRAKRQTSGKIVGEKGPIFGKVLYT